MRSKKKQTTPNLSTNVFAIFSYFSFLCIIPLVFKKDNAFVLHHAKQGLILFVGEVAVFIAHIILGMWIYQLGMTILLLLSLVGIITVFQGKCTKLPVIYKAASSITL
ncbi:hypothetical protein MNBD_BACTEROID05-987 [hydrothermal vent metagenome]|uniref:DUF4870 domain-containing protein n=1 Tax=hydrothermal vent metagenome TaxID=652676 RepID=A0A3B0TD98_9ZZZZ